MMKNESFASRYRSFVLILGVLYFGILTTNGVAQSYTTARLADGFDYPVGPPDGKGYYVYRGFTQNGHLGEDWNGTGGGDSDLKDPVYAIANGVVIFSEDYKRGWGNVIIIRHAYRGVSGQITFVDSLYGHLNVRLKKVGDRVTRGQQIGTIGKGPRGMYTAHLHFEIRRDLRVGMRRDLYPQTYSTYTYKGPRTFINTNRRLRHESRMIRVPINTFQKSNPNKVYVGNVTAPDAKIDTTPRPLVPETTSSVISEETKPEDATPAATRSMLDRLIGRKVSKPTE